MGDFSTNSTETCWIKTPHLENVVELRTILVLIFKLVVGSIFGNKWRSILH